MTLNVHGSCVNVVMPCCVEYQSIVGGKSLAELLLNRPRSDVKRSDAALSSTSGKGKSLEDTKFSMRGVSLLKVLVCTSSP